MDKKCDCPGAGHDPTKRASTRGLCRELRPDWRGADRVIFRICGLPVGHAGPHAWESP